MASEYLLTASASTVQRIADGAFIPFDLGNTDYRAYLAWVEAGNTPDPYVAPPPPPATCLVWQLQAVLSDAQWNAVQTYINGSGNRALIAFASHGTNPISANSVTLAALATVAGIDLATLPALVQEASEIHLE